MLHPNCRETSWVESFTDEMAFFELDALHNIIIPKNVEYIGEQAFKYCRNLRSVQFNNPNCIIGQGVFHGCYQEPTTDQ